MSINLFTVLLACARSQSPDESKSADHNPKPEQEVIDRAQMYESRYNYSGVPLSQNKTFL